MKLIILILANDDSLYIEMQKLWKMYMNNHNNIKSYFIKCNSNSQDEIIIDNDTIFMKGYESLIPGCLDKTIKSIEFFVKNNIDFDFIFRTNLSSVVDLNKLYNLLNNQTYTGVPGSKDWFIDQEIMYSYLINYPHLKILNKPIKRLEVSVYQYHINKGDQNFIMYYDDAHFHRNYKNNELYILDAEKQLNI